MDKKFWTWIVSILLVWGGAMVCQDVTAYSPNSGAVDSNLATYIIPTLTKGGKRWAQYGLTGSEAELPAMRSECERSNDLVASQVKDAHCEVVGEGIGINNKVWWVTCRCLTK